MTLNLSQDSQMLRRLIVFGLLLTGGSYLLLTIAPFFVLGLHQQPAHLVIGGSFDPKGLPGLNAVVYTFGLLLMVVAPIVIAVFAPLILVHSWRRWSALSVSERWIVNSIGLSCLALLLFMFTSPLARLIMIWWLD